MAAIPSSKLVKVRASRTAPDSPSRFGDRSDKPIDVDGDQS
ncbi:hypothetical protein [Microvirga yunnanensis]|nr:hypothetical protein [Microvirga sp. HBU65207]